MLGNPDSLAVGDVLLSTVSDATGLALDKFRVVSVTEI